MNIITINLKNSFVALVGAFVLGLSTSVAGAPSSTQPSFEVSLYTGIPGIGQLGESYKSITENTKLPFIPLDITEDAELLKAGIVYGISFDTVGAKVYFKRSGSCLITIHPPFKGNIKTKQIQLFNMTKPANMTWEDLLIKELGQPNAQGSGGLFGGDVFYYTWGDIEVSRIGLRQLMLYRDRSIIEYRQNTKTSSVKLFK